MDRFIHDGLTFELTDTGSSTGETVLLLHGWPQDRTCWDAVIPTLADSGLRVLAPNLRGYSAGARPARRSAYRPASLIRDAIAVLDAVGVPAAHIVGHDWGGWLAWALATRAPQRVRTLTVLSTPHPLAVQWAVLHSTQALRSWYMAAMQVPAVPELVLRRAGASLLAGSGLPRRDAQRYADRLREPGAAEGSLAWYRGTMSPTWQARRFASGVARGRLGLGAGGGAAPRPTSPSHDGARGHVRVPTTFVWGRRDVAFGRPAAERTGRYVSADYRFLDWDAGHWLPETRPDEVAEVALDRIEG